MTILVGVKCKDGVVIGSDSAATFSSGQANTIEQPTKKIQIIREKYIVAGTGSIGLGQRFCAAAENAIQEKKFSQLTGIAAAVAITERAKDDFVSTRVQLNQYGALMAFPAGGSIHLAEFATSDLQPEIKDQNIWFASMGSGQAIADPFLGLMRQVFWADGMPNLQDGIFTVAWTIQNCIDLNPGGIKEPFDIAILERKGGSGSEAARFLSQDELQEHKENISDAVKHLASFRRKQNGALIAQVPTVPSG